jgi:hypothetical protein
MPVLPVCTIEIVWRSVFCPFEVELLASFRGKFLAFLEESFDAGEMQLYGQLRDLTPQSRATPNNQQRTIYATRMTRFRSF